MARFNKGKKENTGGARSWSALTEKIIEIQRQRSNEERRD